MSEFLYYREVTTEADPFQCCTVHLAILGKARRKDTRSPIYLGSFIASSILTGLVERSLVPVSVLPKNDLSSHPFHGTASN